MKAFLTVLLTIIAAADGAAQADTARHAVPQRALEALRRDPRVTWLDAHVYPVRSVEFDDANFSDLKAIGDAIGQARIVMLGEETHGDGTTLRAKARLVRFLHECLGFDVLAIESGFYDVSKAWQKLEGGEDPIIALSRGVFGTWTTLAEFAPVVSYIAVQAKGKQPLEIAGVDNQLTGTAAVDYLATDLNALLRQKGITTTLLDTGTPFRLGLEGLYGYRMPSAEFVDTLEALRALVARRLGAAKDSTMLYQLLLSIESQSRDLRAAPEADSLWKLVQNKTATPADTFRFETLAYERDRQMGKNLVWLASWKFPRKKIIVWAASSHLIYGHGRYNVSEATSMGEYARARLGTQALYQIGFIPFDGVAFNPWQHQRSWPVEHTDSAIELEDMLHATGNAFAFLDLRHVPRGGEWLNDSLYARPMGNTPVRLRWPEQLDGFFFIDRLEPATPSARGILVRLPTLFQSGARNGFISEAAAGALQRLAGEADAAEKSGRRKEVLKIVNELREDIARIQGLEDRGVAWQKRALTLVKRVTDALR